MGGAPLGAPSLGAGSMGAGAYGAPQQPIGLAGQGGALYGGVGAPLAAAAVGMAGNAIRREDTVDEIMRMKRRREANALLGTQPRRYPSAVDALLEQRR